MNELNYRPTSKYPSIIHNYLSQWNPEWVLTEMLCGQYPVLIDQLNQQYKETERTTLEAIKSQSTRPSGENTLAVMTWEMVAQMQAQELTIAELTDYLEQQYPMLEVNPHLDSNILTI